MSWPADADKPKVKHAHDSTTRGAGWGALWGVLTGALFLVPVVGGVVGVAIGALAKSTEGAGITKEDLTRIRTEVVPGTSALFVVTEQGDLDRLGERFRGGKRHADLHEPHRGRAGDAAGDLRRGLTPDGPVSGPSGWRCR